jgi:hypothetical protein
MKMVGNTGGALAQRLNGETKMKRRAPRGEPHVGIFWLFRGKLVIDSTPFSEGEPYGDHLAFSRSHIDVWEQWRLGGKVPVESEYEEYPRGRIVFNTKTRRFSLLADRCILKDKSMVKKIMSAMTLPNKTTDTGTDAHYRCAACLQEREGE